MATTYAAAIRRCLVGTNVQNVAALGKSVTPATTAASIPPPAAVAAAAAATAVTTTTVPFETIQQGFGRLVAQVDPHQQDFHDKNKNTKPMTRLTRISHKAPARCIPLTASSVGQSSGAAVCFLGNYGGGLLPGDQLHFDIHVQPQARLGLITQGSNRIYKQRRKRSIDENNGQANNASRTTLQATVDQGGLLVVAPDPVTPFADSIYRQEQHVTLTHPQDADLCLIDWFSAGRFANGERWQQTSLHSATKLYLNETNGCDDVNDDARRPILIDSTILERYPDATRSTTGTTCHWGVDWDTVQFNSYASIILYGTERIAPVLERCRNVQYQLAQRETMVRRRADDHGDDDIATSIDNNNNNNIDVLQHLSGRVLVGVSACHLSTTQNNNKNTEASSSSSLQPQLHVARVAATNNEDLYRIFHYCLQPLSEHFGMEFYKDRIRATHSPAVAVPSKFPVVKQASDRNSDRNRINGDVGSLQSDNRKSRLSLPRSSSLDGIISNNNNIYDSSAYWTAFMLADSALPVGSFAHSAGLEAAKQLNLLKGGSTDVARFAQAATQSTVQLAAPLILKSHAWTKEEIRTSKNPMFFRPFDTKLLKELDDYAHALLVSNEPACRASLDQGRSLLRVVIQWLQSQEQKQADVKHSSSERSLDSTKSRKIAILLALQKLVTSNAVHGHLATILGVSAALLELSETQACQLLGYCVGRDIVSAAVRLNLVGPLASVGMLSSIQDAAEQGMMLLISHQQQQQEQQRQKSTSAPTRLDDDPLLAMAAGCAPVLDATHPSHDLLSARLFRT